MLELNGQYLCEKCFLPLAQKDAVCPHCRPESNIEQYLSALPEKTILQGRYVVGKVLGKGGFGVTYLCYDAKLAKRVAIKEYLPDALTHRNSGEAEISFFSGEKEQSFLSGALKFYEEAKMVSRFNGNPNIISVYEFFYENNTAYYVMEYLVGEDLKRYIVQCGGKIREAQAMYVALQVCEAMILVHSRGILHRDISPDNIFVCADGRLKLIDFGAARHMVGEETNSLSVILKQGFAPLEQYQKHGNQGPWTDLYALGATLYYAVTGNVIDDAMSRIEDDTLDFSGISPAFGQVMREMLTVQGKDRMQSAELLKQALLATGIVPEPLTEEHSVPEMPEPLKPLEFSEKPEPPKHPAKRNRKKAVITAAAVLAACALGTAGAWMAATGRFESKSAAAGSGQELEKTTVWQMTDSDETKTTSGQTKKDLSDFRSATTTTNAAITQPPKSKTYTETYVGPIGESGNFTLKLSYEAEKNEKTTITVYRSGNKITYNYSEKKFNVTVINNGRMYICYPFSTLKTEMDCSEEQMELLYKQPGATKDGGIYMEVDDLSSISDYLSFGNVIMDCLKVNDKQFVSEETVTMQDTKYRCETYKDKDGTANQYFFDGNKLKYIKQDGDLFQIDRLSKGAESSAFSLPKGYIDSSILDLL